MELNLPADSYPGVNERVAFLERLLERIRAVTGVRSAGATTNTPAAHQSFDAVYACEGRPSTSASEVLVTADRLVTPGYLETIGVTLKAGRLITRQDTNEAQRVVVVSDELARTCWPGLRPNAPVTPSVTDFTAQFGLLATQEGLLIPTWLD